MSNNNVDIQQLQQAMFQIQQAYDRQQQQLNEQNQLLQQHRAAASNASSSSSSAPLPKPNKPDTFKGTSSTALNWLYGIEQYFKATKATNDEMYMINYAAAALRESASTWWQSIERVANENNNPITTWAQWRKVFLDHYQPMKAAEQAREKLYNLIQSSTVSKYIDLFNNNLLHISDMSDNDKLFQFLRGLHPDIYREVHLQHPTSLVLAQNYALKAELDNISRASWFKRNRNSGGKSNHQGYNGGNYQRGNNVPPANAAGGATPMELGQLSDASTTDSDNVNPPESELNAIGQLQKLDEAARAKCMKEGRCFRCRNVGHVSRNCPNNNNKPAPKKY
jgi:hypothetical protein